MKYMKKHSKARGSCSLFIFGYEGNIIDYDPNKVSSIKYLLIVNCDTPAWSCHKKCYNKCSLLILSDNK